MKFLEKNYKSLDRFLLKNKIKNIFLVCDKSFPLLKISTYFNNIQNRLKINVKKFSDFEPNPDFESVKQGVLLFQEGNFDIIFAIGGGSTIDVAKCIKLYSKSDLKEGLPKVESKSSLVKLVAIPTTAGTGSEATSFAVVYEYGEKKSIASKVLLPECVFFDTTTLDTLPEYQKKCTYLDALCHAIESSWAVGANATSLRYSKKAIKQLIAIYPDFLTSSTVSKKMFLSANLAGKAINISKTTAGHAMSYKLTSLYKIAHGHAVSLCLPYVWEELINYANKTNDTNLHHRLRRIASAFGCKTPEDAVQKFKLLVKNFNLDNPKDTQTSNLKLLVDSVNVERLSNFPIALDKNTIASIYKKIVFE